MIHIVVLSGGTGSRMGSSRPKQFLTLGGRPLLSHCLETFAQWSTPSKGGLVLVSHAEHLQQTEALLKPVQDHFAFVRLVTGGHTRHASSVNGALALERECRSDDIVLFHDGARPFLSEDELNGLTGSLSDDRYDCASLASPATETIAVVDEDGQTVRDIPPRSRLFAVKTPQAIRGKLLPSFIAGAEPASSYTDLLSWAKANHCRSVIVPASPRNVKVTHPDDLAFLESMI